jgi:xanthine dehydrogenase YagS FAD-binding subunit
MGTLAGNLLQSTRCWYWRLNWPCRLHGGDECFAREGEHREHAIFANDFCASAHPSDVAAALLALNATLETTKRRLPIASLYRLPTEDDRRTTTIEPGELVLSVEVPDCDASVYLKAMERKRWAFPLVGVAAVRRGASMRLALAGVAPVPWLLDGELDGATPLPRNAYKVEIATALVKRARSAVAS